MNTSGGDLLEDFAENACGCGIWAEGGAAGRVVDISFRTGKGYWRPGGSKWTHHERLRGRVWGILITLDNERRAPRVNSPVLDMSVSGRLGFVRSERGPVGCAMQRESR